MKKIIISLLFLVCFAMNAYSQPYYTQKNMSSMPFAAIEQDRFEFEPVIEGTEVLHDFIIENKGNEPLIIYKISTSCGCTTASYTKNIPPETKGKITLKANTKGYGGKKFSKSATIYTNDPRKKPFKIYISGNIEKFAIIAPNRIVLRGAAGTPLQSVVSITPDKKYPFNIVDSYSDKLNEKVRFSVEKKNDRYLLTVNNLVKTPGNYHGKIHLKTDNPVKPEITIPVSGIITEKSS